MATIYKRRDLRPIPEGAEIVTYRGKRYAKWVNAKTGNAQRALLSEAGDKIVCESPYYTIQYFDSDGRRQKVATRCADRDAAQQIANELEARATKRREGLIDATQERHAAQQRRPLGEHLADFRAALVAKGNTPEHCQETYLQALRVAQRCQAATTRDLTASAVQAAIKALRDDGRSLKTCNHYLRAIKTFTRWMHRDKRIADDPLVSWKRTTRRRISDASGGKCRPRNWFG